MIRNNIKTTFFAAFIMLAFITGGAAADENFDTVNAYRDAQFSQTADFLGKKDYNKLSLEEKLLLIECLARTAETGDALKKMDKILADAGQSPTTGILTTAGVVYTSLGRLQEAKDFIRRALALDKNFPRAKLAEAMLHLYYQEYEEAEISLHQIAEKYPGWEKTNLFLFAGLEIYKASRNPKKLKETYDLLAKKHKKINKRHYQNAKANSRLLKKAVKGKLFAVTAAADRVVLPMENYRPREAKKIIHLKTGNKTFKVLLDTGNAVGWFVYSRELKELLNAERGGSSLTRMGLETGALEGYHILCKNVDFGGFKMDFPAGQYVPKPYPEFFDANLNPVFIRDRVVSLDYINQKLVLSSKERFDKELAGSTLDSVSLPWYGYERAFVPVTVNKDSALGMIETGAEDIALKLDFARQRQFPLKAEKRYLANGKVFEFFRTPVDLAVGKFHFVRLAAEVWPLNRIYNPVTGLTADVIIGPSALEGKFIVSFDPFDKKIILQYKKSR